MVQWSFAGGPQWSFVGEPQWAIVIENFRPNDGEYIRGGRDEFMQQGITL